MITPLISIIMSTYNRADMVTETVESILNQTVSDFEFIIIDDNSTDNTYEILKKIKDKRIRLLSNKKNCGCTFNYHAANNLAKGKYIAHIDDDDISYPNRFEKQILFMDKNKEIALSGTFIETFGEHARPSWVLYSNPKKLDFMMNFYNPICHSSIIYRKSFIDRYAINYDVTKKCAQDYDFYKQILFKGGLLANIDGILVKYRMHPKRLTEIKTTQDIQIFHAEQIKKELLSRFFDSKEIENITLLMKGFPFNEYNIESVLKGIDITKRIYKKTDNSYEKIIEEIENDIKNNSYMF